MQQKNQLKFLPLGSIILSLGTITALSSTAIAQPSLPLHSDWLQDWQRQREFNQLGDPPKKKDRDAYREWQRQHRELQEKHEIERQLERWNVTMPSFSFSTEFEPSFFLRNCISSVQFYLSFDLDMARREIEQCKEMEKEERENYQRQQQIRENQTVEYQDKMQLFQQAKNLLKSGNFTGAEVIFRHLMNRYPADARLHYQLGNSLHGQNQLEAAIEAYQQAIRVNPNHGPAHQAIATIRARQNRWQEAIEEYGKALEITPNDAELHLTLGQALQQQGKVTEAIALLKKAKDLFEQQGKLPEANQVEQLLQQVSQQ